MEIGRFGYDQMYQKQVFCRCPKCKHIFPSWQSDMDILKLQLKFRSYCDRDGHARKRMKLILKDVDKKRLMGYILYCPECHDVNERHIYLDDLKKVLNWAKRNKINEKVFPSVCWSCKHIKVKKNCESVVKRLVDECEGKGKKIEMMS
jgi:hypothetical protein